MIKLDLIEKYFEKNPIYFLDSARYHRQKHTAVKTEECLVGERWIQFWGVVITILVVPIGIYLGRGRFDSNYNVLLWMDLTVLILIESVFVCSLMIAVVWEGFSSFSKDMSSGIYEIIMTSLLEPEKVLWGKFIHIFIHFIKFILIGFTILLILSVVTSVSPEIILIILSLNTAAGCLLIVHRLHSSAKEAYSIARNKYGCSALGNIKGRFIKGLIENAADKGEKLLVYLLLTFVFAQVQLLLLANLYGDLSMFPLIIRNLAGNFTITIMIQMFLPMVFLLLFFTYVFFKRTKKIISDII